MPKAAPANTTNARPAPVTAAIPADRRTMLAGIVAALAFPAVAAASDVPAAGAIADPEDRIATPEECAAIKFEAIGPELRKVLGTPDEWLQQARAEYMTWQIVVAVLEKDDVQTFETAKLAGAPEAMCSLIDHLDNLLERYEASARIIGAAQLRTMAGLSRYALLAEDMDA